MKSVLISIKPQWCKLIANGKKTIEVRKTSPKLVTPFKCYIYKTNGGATNSVEKELNNLGKVIGEFVCDEIIYPIFYKLYDIVVPDLRKQSCMTLQDFRSYGNGEPLYGWHISDLVIYDKPRELSGFKRFVDRSKGQIYREDMLFLQRPPQSWCYVEEL